MGRLSDSDIRKAIARARADDGRYSETSHIGLLGSATLDLAADLATLAAFVRGMIGHGLSDDDVAEALGMPEDVRAALARVTP